MIFLRRIPCLLPYVCNCLIASAGKQSLQDGLDLHHKVVHWLSKFSLVYMNWSAPLFKRHDPIWLTLVLGFTAEATKPICVCGSKVNPFTIRTINSFKCCRITCGNLTHRRFLHQSWHYLLKQNYQWILCFLIIYRLLILDIHCKFYRIHCYLIVIICVDAIVVILICLDFGNNIVTAETNTNCWCVYIYIYIHTYVVVQLVDIFVCALDLLLINVCNIVVIC